MDTKELQYQVEELLNKGYIKERLQPDGSGSLAERQRIFLVADDWPASGTEPGGAPPSAT